MNAVLTERQAFAAAFISGLHAQLLAGFNDATEESKKRDRAILAKEAWALADAMIEAEHAGENRRSGCTQTM